MSDLDWLSASECVSLVKLVHNSATEITIRKAIVGMVYDGALTAIAGTFKEHATPIDHDGIGARNLGATKDECIPRDFWRYEHATGQFSVSAFETGIFSVDLETTAGELPYRFRKVVDGATNGPRCRLFQIAHSVTFDRSQLVALIDDQNWQRWTKVIDENERIRRRGVVPRWQWDEVKARLTVEASRNPALVSGGSGPIADEMKQMFAQLHGNAHPDNTDIYGYAKLVASYGKPYNEDAPNA